MAKRAWLWHNATQLQFDGIAADAPGLSLPRAAVAEAWDTQALAAVIKTPKDALPVAMLSRAFSDSDLTLVRDAVLAACDADDGLTDGMVNDFTHCTSARVRPQLDGRRCQSSKLENCLSGAQIDALSRVLQGPHDSRGEALYSDWPWDTGIAAPGWRLWKLGSPSGASQPERHSRKRITLLALHYSADTSGCEPPGAVRLSVVV